MKFSQKLRIGNTEKLVFLRQPFFFKKKLLFLHENQSKIMCWNGWDSIFYYDDLQPKMSTGIIKEHECKISTLGRNSKIRFDKNRANTS